MGNDIKQILLALLLIASVLVAGMLTCHIGLTLLRYLDN